MRLLQLVSAAVILFAAPAMAQQGFLENPADFSNESGIGVVSGFHCTAQVIEIQFDQYDPIAAASGTGRLDTETFCGGNSDTGFALLWNWNILGPGQHTVRAIADGIEFDSATVTVHTFGQEFVTGINANTDILLLGQGKEVYIRWQEPKQNFGIVDIEPSDLTLELLMMAVEGDWAGTWYSTSGNGSISLTFVESAYGTPELSSFQLAGTGCAESGVSTGVPFNVNEPIIEVLMGDGSIVEMELGATENVSMLGGTFYFDSGPCEEAEGIYILFRD